MSDWISVNDKLPLQAPESDYIRGRFLVWQNYFINPQIADFVIFADGDHDWTLPNLSGRAKEHVTHWMPLPEPPK